MDNEIILVPSKLSRPRFQEIAALRFGDMVKGVVDIEKRIMAIGGDLHADEEAYLLERGSVQENLWGVNLQHQNLAGGKWQAMSLAEQLGNIGSEYERAWSWKQKNNLPYFEKAFFRMIELIDLTLTDPRWKGLRLREIARLREQVCEELTETGKTKSLSKYFLQFAVEARG